MINKIGRKFANYREYVHPTIRTRGRFVRYMLTKGSTEIEFSNGLVRHFVRGEEGHLNQITRGLFLLKQRGVGVYANGATLTIILPSDEKLVADASRLTNTELVNLLMLIYYCIRFDTPITGKRTSINREVRPSVLVDLKRKIVVVNDSVRFHLRFIEAGIFAETYILGIHWRFKDVPHHGVAIDAGAAWGDTALFFASLGMTVYSIEPIKPNFDAMVSNIELNPALKGRIHPIHAALGNDTELKFTYDDTSLMDGGASAYLEHYTVKPCTEVVRAYSLTSLCKALEIKRIDYLKTDCKGAEFYLTRRDLDLVSKYIKIEFQSGGSNYVFDKLTKLVRDSGFEYSVVKNFPDDSSSVRVDGTIYGIRKGV